LFDNNNKTMIYIFRYEFDFNDFISAEELRISYDIPPFTRASTEQAHTGINYASGGAGLLEETSQHLVRTE